MGSINGVIKAAALRIGISLEDYLSKKKAGLKYCTKCKTWQSIESFNMDKMRGDGRSSKCKACNYIKKRQIMPCPSQKIGTLAVEAVRRAIRNGRISPANKLPCFYCGKKAEHYHHYLGYEKSHFLDVKAVCRGCHRKIHFK